jgi:GDP/UDP-N,N'-diacetylbacillosamine 2-epimerase (hydrolysing)
VKEQFTNLLQALDRHPEYQYVFTKANADTNGRIINEMMEEYAASRSNVKVFASLGMLRYLSAMSYCSMVIGNSSSGLLEAPSFGIATVNIGNRQKGRIKCASILDCTPETEAISAAISKAGTEEMKQLAMNVINPYGDGITSDKVVVVLIDYLLHGKIDLKKRFYDINFMV